MLLPPRSYLAERNKCLKLIKVTFSPGSTGRKKRVPNIELPKLKHKLVLSKYIHEYEDKKTRHTFGGVIKVSKHEEPREQEIKPWPHESSTPVTAANGLTPVVGK